METIEIRTTTREELVDITALVRAAVRKSGIDDGLVCVFCPHTTAAITIQEGTDPNVKKDVLNQLRRAVPREEQFSKSDENADAHIKSSVIGPSVTFIVDQGRLALGHWQAIFFCEFDGPRDRKVFVAAR